MSKPPISSNEAPRPGRRRLLGSLLAGVATAVGVGRARAAESSADELRFPGDPVSNKIVYQFNKIDPDYQGHVLFSVGALLRKYGDNIKIVVTCFGPGIHLLAEHPQHPVSDENKARVRSLSQYGVEFHACDNTLKTLGWNAFDMVPFAKIVEAGAADLMELQQQGFSYVSW
jgi:uncharacterized protein